VDGSCKDGKMGSECCNFKGEEADKFARVGREGEGMSSNRPELGEVLCVIKKWVGQGGNPTIATAPDADILQEIVCLRTQRVRAGRATSLIKV